MFGVSCTEKNPLDLLLQLTEHALVQPFELRFVVMVMKEEVYLVYHYYPQLSKINWPSSITEIFESSKRRNYNMTALPLACTNQV